MNKNNELELDEDDRRIGVVEEGENRVDVKGLSYPMYKKLDKGEWGTKIT